MTKRRLIRFKLKNEEKSYSAKLSTEWIRQFSPYFQNIFFRVSAKVSLIEFGKSNPFLSAVLTQASLTSSFFHFFGRKKENSVQHAPLFSTLLLQSILFPSSYLILFFLQKKRSFSSPFSEFSLFCLSIECI